VTIESVGDVFWGHIVDVHIKITVDCCYILSMHLSEYGIGRMPVRVGNMLGCFTVHGKRLSEHRLSSYRPNCNQSI